MKNASRTGHFTCKKLRCFSVLPSKILHRYSIASPSFRWSIYGELMAKRWRNLKDSAMPNTCILSYFLSVFTIRLICLDVSGKKCNFAFGNQSRAPLYERHALFIRCRSSSYASPVCEVLCTLALVGSIQ